MSFKGVFETVGEQAILGGSGTQAPNVYVVINVTNGAVQVDGQYFFDERRSNNGGGPQEHGPKAIDPIKLRKGQSAVLYAYWVKVTGILSEGSKTPYGAGNFEVSLAP